MTNTNGPARRRVLAGVGAAAVAALAGCTAGGSDTPTETDTSVSSGEGSDAATTGGDTSPGTETETETGGEAAYGGWMEGVTNYEETVDRTGESEVTVAVGAVDGFRFDPPAVAVDVGTTITWEWTGRGSRHNVVEEGGGYESEYYTSEGATFTHTVRGAGVSKYYCAPHRAVGMKGVIEVVEE